MLSATCGGFTVTRALLDLLLQSLRSVPSLAWVPLFVLWLGIFERSKITLIAVGVFFPVYLNLMSGIANLDRKLIEVGEVHGYSRFGRLVHIQLPAAMPAYTTGLRNGLGLGWMFVSATLRPLRRVDRRCDGRDQRTAGVLAGRRAALTWHMPFTSMACASAMRSATCSAHSRCALSRAR